jgi:hypothetical protein
VRAVRGRRTHQPTLTLTPPDHGCGGACVGTIQPQHERPGPRPRLHPRKPARDPAQQLIRPCLPPGRRYLYAVAGAHRGIFGCPHTTGSSTVAALSLASSARSQTSQVTISGWSTRDSQNRTSQPARLAGDPIRPGKRPGTRPRPLRSRHRVSDGRGLGPTSCATAAAGPPAAPPAADALGRGDGWSPRPAAPQPRAARPQQRCGGCGRAGRPPDRPRPASGATARG